MGVKIITGKYIKSIMLAILTLMFLDACSSKTSLKEENAYTLKGDTVFVHSELKESGIKLAAVEEESASREVITAGSIQRIPSQYAEIASPFAGRIVKSFVNLGQKVLPGSPVFEINSPEFFDIAKSFQQAKQEMDFALKNLNRQKDLLRNRVGVEKETEEAEINYELRKKEYENLAAAIRVYQIEPSALVLGQSLIVRSPVGGEIIKDDIVIGQYLHADAEPVVAVADLSRVWITAQVKEKDVRFIREGDGMNIHVAALPDYTVEGRVYYIDRAVDEDTRSIKVLSICDNRNDDLKIGMYASVYFSGRPESYLVFPEKALLQGESYAYVLRQCEPEVFVRVAVDIDFTKDRRAYSRNSGLGGLKHGDIIVAEGGYYFK